MTWPPRAARGRASRVGLFGLRPESEPSRCICPREDEFDVGVLARIGSGGLHLTGKACDHAVTAHRRRTLVSATGRLERSGTTAWLRDAFFDPQPAAG